VKLEERKEDADARSVRPVPSGPRRRPGSDDEKPDKSRNKSGLGISVKTLTPEGAKQSGLDGARGAFVVSVERGSVSDENGLTADDVIIEMNNKSVATQEDFLRATRDLKSGDDVVIKVLRKERGPLRRMWIVSFTMP
jgi:S1-C subfamily serine protease